MKRFLAYSLAIAALVLASCGETPEVLTVDWQPDGSGYVQYKTNDTANYSKWFVHVPAEAGNSLPSGADWHIEADLMQKAGTVVGARGIIFNYESGTKHYKGLVVRFSVNDSDQMIAQYCTLINSGFGPDLGSWTTIDFLNYDPQVNKLRADYDSVNDKVTFSINGHTLTATYDNDATAATQAGFINQILDAKFEGFPSYSSDRRFKLIQPVAYPAS